MEESDDEDTSNSKRPDRTEKLKLRKTHCEIVVKACLLKHLVGTKDEKERIRDAIESRVLAYSKRARACSLALHSWEVENGNSSVAQSSSISKLG